jgi:DNA mismatch repair protein MutS2
MITSGPAIATTETPDMLGGLADSIRLLEFDQIRRQLASYTRTIMGQEAALSLVPSREWREIDVRQRETTEARQFLGQGAFLEFGPGLDLREYVRRALLGGILRGEELHAVQATVRAASYDRAILARRTEFRRLNSIAENIPDLGDLETAIGSAISESGEVLDEASPELRQFRQESRAAYQRLNEVMERTLRRLQRLEVVQEPLVVQRNGRLVLLIKTEMKSRVPGIIHDVSDSGATVFIEPMAAIDLGNQWRELRLAEEREEERILRQLSSQVGRQGEALLLTLDLIARLDLAMAKGHYSLALNAEAPSLVDNLASVLQHQESDGQGALSEEENASRSPLARGAERHLWLRGARHPLLSGKVVPVSLELGGDYRVMVITGPNAGGKTVTLKTIGLLALMAQAGLHVPADEAHFPLFDSIYADIGDQQSIAQSLSTFSSHIQNLCSIMSQATPNSLVMLDELGTSTDPEEGSALAKAILGYFQQRGLLLVATTHHRSVARYVQEQPGMINASVDLNAQTLEPTYRVTLGLPGRSYALTIAARLGLEQDIVEHARSLLSPEERSVENLLRELQEERHLVDQLHQQAEAALALAKQQQAEMETQLASLETTKRELVEQVRQQLRDRIADLLSRLQQAEHSVSQLQSPDRMQGQEPQSLDMLRTSLNEARRQISSPNWQPIELKLPTWYERLESGDRVFIRGISRPVEVIAPPDEQGQLEVLLGTMRARIPVYQLERQDEILPGPPLQKGVGEISGVYFSRPGRPQPSTEGAQRADEIDLRGLRVESALEKVEKFLNTAALDGLRTTRIIHGRGTGALRRAIREHLADHPLVASAAPGEGPGGDGVTVVELT